MVQNIKYVVRWSEVTSGEGMEQILKYVVKWSEVRSQAKWSEV
jgi:hypothetical protein